jgi:coenzyme F420-0:L-glutamate ligase/coenzyme F420-1:gamma-L-glutamate ligase
LVTTEIAAGDELAAAASILMGQGDQRKPIVLINGYKDNTKVTTNAKALGILKKDDLYGN